MTCVLGSSKGHSFIVNTLSSDLGSTNTQFLPAGSPENGVWNTLLLGGTGWMGHLDMPSYPVVPVEPSLQSVLLSHKPYNLQANA